MIVVGAQLGGAMKVAAEKAGAAAVDFARENSGTTALVALGIVVILLPSVIEILGLSSLGPADGSFASRWQST